MSDFMLKRLEIDRAVFYALTLRGWQLTAGVVSALLITACLSPAAQGFYYTFASVIALQSFFELGFQIVVVNAASHEWSRLRLDERGAIQGDARSLSRLVSLGRLIFSWYAAASFLFVVVVGAGGVMFFQWKDQPLESLVWRGPWIVMVLLSGLLLWTLPFNALLEGCGQVAVINRFRFYQAVTANLALWTGLLSGGVLWAAAMATAARLLCDLYLLLVHYRTFFQTFLRTRVGDAINWAHDLWPMQWRLALGGVFSYLEFFLLTPVMFHFRDPETAGRMGMTWTLISILQMASLAWTQSRAPLFGQLVARGQFDQLEKEFRKTTLISLLVVIAGAIAIVGGVLLLGVVHNRLSQRLLPPLPTALFAIAAVVYHVPKCIDFYVRAHKKEIMLPVHIVQNIAIGSLIVILGARWGPQGAAIGYLSVIVCFTFPAKVWLFFRFRARRNTEEGRLNALG